MNSRHQLPSYPLRMEEELREKIAAAAKESGRSMNAEIVARLEGSFGLSLEPSHDLVEAMKRAYREVLAERGEGS